MSDYDRVRELGTKVKLGEITELDAQIHIKRLKEEIETLEMKIRGGLITQLREMGAEGRTVRYGKVHVYLDKRQDNLFDHDPEWVAANNRKEAIERQLIEGLKDGAMRTARRGPVVPVVRIFLRGIPLPYRPHVH